jgi:NADH-quinone oxidoreductase subunit G
MHRKFERTRRLYHTDKVLQLQKSQDNVFVTRRYTDFLGGVGEATAHELLHTHDRSRRRLPEESFPAIGATAAKKVQVGVCLGTSCFLRVVPPSSSTASCSTRRSGK